MRPEIRFVKWFPLILFFLKKEGGRKLRSLRARADLGWLGRGLLWLDDIQGLRNCSS